MKTHVKKGDNVTVIAGNYKGKSGKVLSVNTAKQQVIVEGVRKITKAVRPKQTGEEGGLKVIDGPVHISNVKKA